jgi:TIR domain
MPGIFISYRREDSAAYAGRLYDQLVNRFGKDKVFMDVDTIEPGVDYVEILQQTVSSCDAMIAVIGRQWLAMTDAGGRRRLDDPEDLVRIEISTALRRNIRVIPALVAGAHMPTSEDLPNALASLARRNAIEISDVSFHETLRRLLDTLEKILNEPSSSPLLQPIPQSSSVTPIEIHSSTHTLPAAASSRTNFPLEKLTPWRQWLLLYRPYSVGGTICRVIFFPALILSSIGLKELFSGNFKGADDWGALGSFLFVALCSSIVGHWFDKRALRARSR